MGAIHAPISGGRIGRLRKSVRNSREAPWVRRGSIVVLLALVAAYPASIPGIGPGFGFLDASNAGLDVAYLAEVYILLALGLNVVVGFAGLLDLGYAAFFAIGGYTVGLLASPLLGPVIQGGTGNHTYSNILLSVGPNGIHINVLVLIPVAAVVAALFGLTFGAPTLRLRGDYLAIVTLGFGEIVPIVIQNLGNDNGLLLGRHNGLPVPNLTNGVFSVTGIDTPPNVNLLGAHLTFQGLSVEPWYYLGLIIITVSVVVVVRLRDSRLGRSWVAIREDEVAAAHAGINVTATRLTAFALGAAFSGFGGLLYATQLGVVSFDQFSFNVSITILVMVILGGIGSVPGVMLGGFLIAYLSETWLDTLSVKLNLLGSWLAHGPYPIGGQLNLGNAHIVSLGRWLDTVPLATAKPMVLGIILVAMMLLRPQGIWPSRTRARELKPQTQAELAEEQEDLYTVRTGQI